MSGVWRLTCVLVALTLLGCGPRLRRRPRPEQTYRSAVDPARESLSALIGEPGRGPYRRRCRAPLHTLTVRMGAVPPSYPRAYGREQAEAIALLFECDDLDTGISLRSLGHGLVFCPLFTVVSAVHEMSMDTLLANQRHHPCGTSGPLLLPEFEPAALRTSSYTSLSRLYSVRDGRAFVVEPGTVLELAPNAQLHVVWSVQRARAQSGASPRPIAELALRLQVRGVSALFLPELDEAEQTRLLAARCPVRGPCPALAADALIVMGLERRLDPRLVEAVGASMWVSEGEPQDASASWIGAPSTHSLEWREARGERWSPVRSPTI